MLCEERLDFRAFSSLSFTVLFAHHFPFSLECALLPSRLLIIEELWIADRSLAIRPPNVHGFPVEGLWISKVRRDQLLGQQVAGKKAFAGTALKRLATGEKL